MKNPPSPYLFTKLRELLTYCNSYLNSIINIRNVNILFILSAIAVLASHILFTTGLYNDGADNLYHIIAYDTPFYGREQSRIIFNIFTLIPTYLFVKIPISSSLNLLVAVFSFGLIWVHILSFIGCYLILPKNKKHMIFFPLFTFFIGPVISLHISISAALSVCSYVWFVTYTIYYSDLSRKIHKVLFFILPLPLILSHELMSYMAWLLIYLCWQKIKIEKNLFNKVLIVSTIIFLFVTSVIQTFMTIFHEKLTNTDANDMERVIDNIMYFDFLFKPNFNFLLVLSLLTMILFLIQPYKDTIKHKLKKTLIILYSLIFIFVATASILQTTGNFFPALSIRLWPLIIPLPLGLLLWKVHEKKNIYIEKISRLFLLSCMLFCLTLVFCRITFDYKFYKYQTAMATYLSKCKGIIKRRSILNHFKNTNFFNYKMISSQDQTIFPESLLYPKSRIVRSAISPSSLYGCIENCEFENKDKQYKENCNKLCVEQPTSVFLSEFTEVLYENKFFDTSEVTHYITNNISKCEK